jgi:Leucine-rich repeat (LRR) protein
MYGTKYISSFLQHSQTLKFLNLASNPLQMEGFLEIAAAIDQNPTHLRVLDVSDCKITTDSKQKYNNLERLKTPLCHNLKVLKLSGNNFASKARTFWSYLLSMSTLETLEIARGLLAQKEKDIHTLADYLAQLPNLTYLDVSDNYLEEVAMEKIAFSLLLAPHTCLKALVLMGNSVSEKSASIIAQALRFNSKLQVLVLARSHISDRGLQELDNGLSGNKASKISRIIITRKTRLTQPPHPSLQLRHPHVFHYTEQDPTYTYQMRWSPD